MALTRVLLKAMLRDRATAGVLIALTVLLCLPVVIPLQVFGLNNPAFAEMQRMNFELSKQNAADEQGVPEELVALDKERFQAMSVAASASTAREKWAAFAEAEATLEKTAELGYSEWDADSEAYLRFYELAARLDDVGVATNSTELPALYYVSYALALVPFQLWLCVSAWTCWRVCKLLGPRSLLARAPVGSAGLYVSMLATCILASLLMLALPLVVPFALALLRNGLGSPLAPITYIANGKVIETTVATSICGWLGVITLQNCLAATVAAFAFRLTVKPAAGLAAYGIHLVLSLSQVVSQASGLPGFKCTPWPYSDPARAFGCFGSWPNMVVVKFELLQGSPSLLVLLIWFLTFLAVGLAVVFIRERRRRGSAELA